MIQKFRAAVFCLSVFTLPASACDAADQRAPASAALMWKDYVNVRYKYRVCFPSTLLKAQREPDNSDGKTFKGADGSELLVYGTNNVDNSTLATEAEAEAHSYTGTSGKITYRARGRNWVVLSGNDGRSKLFYNKTMQRGDQFMTFQLKYPKASAVRYGKIVDRISRCFQLTQ